MLKELWFDGQELLLLVKRLERRRLVWPQVEGGKSRSHHHSCP